MYLKHRDWMILVVRHQGKEKRVGIQYSDGLYLLTRVVISHRPLYSIDVWIA